jgi:hypothetical protein
LGFKVSKNCYYDLKTFFIAKFELGYQNNGEFYADVETLEKTAKKLLT